MKYWFLALFIWISIYSEAQEFNLLGGLRFRPAPIYVGNRSIRTSMNSAETGILFQQDKHLVGLALPITGRIHFKKIGFSQFSFITRYDELFTVLDPNSGVNELKTRLFFDFSISHSFPIFSISANSILYLGAGISWNNYNSDYTTPIKDPGNSSIVLGYKTQDLRFSTIDLPITLDYKKSSFSITPSYTIKQQFPLLSNNFFLINCGWQYNILKPRSPR